MTYIIIHNNLKTLDKCTVKIVNRYLKKGILSLKKIAYDPDFCLIKKEDKGHIKIEQVKKLQKQLLFTPFNKKHQFGIIQEAHLMTVEAQNALLKTLEECNENTILILTTNSESAVLQTILSRCTRVYPDEKKLEEGHKELSNNIETFLTKPIYEQINEIEKITKEHREEEFLNDLIEYYRERNKRKIIQNKNTQEETKIIEMISEAKHRISKNVNTKMALEYICFQINHR